MNLFVILRRLSKLNMLYEGGQFTNQFISTSFFSPHATDDFLTCVGGEEQLNQC